MVQRRPRELTRCDSDSGLFLIYQLGLFTTFCTAVQVCLGQPVVIYHFRWGIFEIVTQLIQ